LDLNKIKKLAIIRLSSLGDILLTTPLIRSIKKKFPEINMDFIVKKQYKDLLLYNPYLQNILTYNTNNKAELFNEFKKNNYDFILDLQNNFRSAEIKRILKTPATSFNKNTFNKFLLVHFKINKLKKLPSMPERYAKSLDGFSLDNEGLDLFLPDGINSLLKNGSNYIGFAPGSRHYTKMWPENYYIELGNILSANNFQVALFGGKNDKQICRSIAGKIENSLNLSNDDDLFQTAADMKKCTAIVCNDSGFMHVASALKIPVLAFFGSTVKEFGFAPYKNKNIILENNSLNCRPCSHIGRGSCPKKHFKCMTELSPETAFNKLKLILNS
jgi:ADP-heptose:LPS heptosyltransferase